MRRYLYTTLHPDIYHGHNKKPPFFEGWYFKLIDKSETQRYAVIPGIFLSNDPEKHHAFIQILDGMTGKATYHSFPADQFIAAAEEFDIRLGENHFTRQHIRLAINDEYLRITGEVHFEQITPFPVTLRAPGIMGWYGWIPFMECYHGIVSLDHTLNGVLNLNNTALDFTGGRGYIEKDWGKSFPSAYVWMQTNHFDTPNVCLSASIAMIPSVGRTFRGFIIAFWLNRTLYRMATYTGAQVEKLEITDDFVTWTVRDRHYQLTMQATRAAGGLLMGPARTEMHKRVDETLKATVEVKLIAHKDGHVVFHETGRNAGLEVHGDLQKLLSSH